MKSKTEPISYINILSPSENYHASDIFTFTNANNEIAEECKNRVMRGLAKVNLTVKAHLDWQLHNFKVLLWLAEMPLGIRRSILN